jgi:hypothetical protein
MARGQTIIVGGGVGAIAPFTTGAIPVIASTDPAAITTSIMRQVTVGAVTAIINGVTDPNSAAAEQFRTAGGIISTGTGLRSTRIGRNNTIIGADSIGIGDTITETSIAAQNILIGKTISVSTSGNIAIGNTISSDGNNDILIGATLTAGAGSSNNTFIGGSVSVGVGIVGVIALTTIGGIGVNPIFQAGMTYITHGSSASNSLVVGGSDTSSVTARTGRIRPTNIVGGGNNLAAADLQISGGLGTGNAAASVLIFNAGVAKASGNTVHTLSEILRLADVGATFSRQILATPVAGTALTVTGIAASVAVIIAAGGGTDPSIRFNGYTTGAAAQVGTLNNSPAAGNPAFWLRINIAGTDRFLPCW